MQNGNWMKLYDLLLLTLLLGWHILDDITSKLEYTFLYKDCINDSMIVKLGRGESEVSMTM